jgi:starch synthase
MYSLRYGTVPIVHHTGGLADTVVNVTHATLANGTATGFVFDEPAAESLWRAVERAIDFYHRPDATWQILATAGMQQDFSWKVSASRYTELYRAAIEGCTG